MQQSKYNIVLNKDNIFLLYNNISGEVIIMGIDKYQEFLTNNLSENEKVVFQKRGFYVPDNFSEYDFLLARSKMNDIRSKTSKFRILTTTTCNANCFYCYEQGVKPFFMNEKVIDDTINFIIDNSKNSNNISIEWFGGEPLLNVNAIDRIVEGLKKSMKTNQYFYSNIVSNGSLITDEIAYKMKNTWNIKDVQITIDGVDDAYDKIKLIDSFTFKDIISKIQILIKHQIKVSIRVNYNQYNLKDIEKVIKFFSESEMKDDIHLYASKIFDFKQRNFYNLEEETIYVDRLLHQYGFTYGKDLLPKIMKQPCQANKIDYFTLNANGDVFKCDRKLLADDRIGHVSNFQHDLKKVYQWINPNLPEKCKDCVLMPNCWGGCIYDRINQLDYCYYTLDILKNRLSMVLEDYMKTRGHNL